MVINKQIRNDVFDKAINISVICRRYIYDNRIKHCEFMKELGIELYYINTVTVSGIEIFIYMTTDKHYRCKGIKYRNLNEGAIILSDNFISTYRRFEQIEFINYAILNIMSLINNECCISEGLNKPKTVIHFPKFLIPKFIKFIKHSTQLER